MAIQTRFLAALCLPLALPAQEVQAELYRPAEPVLTQVYPPANLDERTPLKPILHLYGKDLRTGKGRLEWQVRAGSRNLLHGAKDFTLKGTVLEQSIELADPCPGADQVAWTLVQDGRTSQGVVPLRWSAFSGRVDFADGRPRPVYILLNPVSFQGTPFTIPVHADGTFQAQVPARSYAVVNVNSAGYAIDTLERWAWDFDLTGDRAETFRVGRTELYGMKAFCLVGGSDTVFVTFRPSALTRLLQHRADPKAGPRDAATMAVLGDHMKIDPMSLAPNLALAGVKVWLDGQAQTPADLARIRECGPGGADQSLYILQFRPSFPLTRGTRHEVKVEVESQDVLNGKLITDSGQGSAGLRLD
jgi:hypothetical protein